MSRLTFAQAEIKQPVEFSSSFGNKLGMFSGNIFTGEMPDIAISRPGHDFGKIAINRSDAFHSAAIAQQDDEPELDELEDKAEQELKLKKIFRRRKSSITNSEEEGKSITPTKSVKERKYTVNQKKKDAEGEQTASPPMLTIGKPDDSFEQEADQVADIIAEESTSTADYSLPKSQITPQVQRQCEECKIEAPQGEEAAEEEEEEEVEPTKIDRKKEGNSDNNTTNATLRNLESKLKASKGGGQPLPDATRQMMENRFGVNFGKVRIHAGDEASWMNRSIQAKAFTHGNDIYYNQGKYTPHTQDGQWLLAHELAHVIQQTGANTKNPTIRRSAEPKIGNWAHFRIQEKLRKRDSKLITEAPIPGGTRIEMKHNVVGFADLYKAENNTIAGISAQEPSESTILEEKFKFYKYVNMRRDWLNKATPNPTDKNIGPKITNNKKNIELGA